MQAAYLGDVQQSYGEGTVAVQILIGSLQYVKPRIDTHVSDNILPLSNSIRHMEDIQTALTLLRMFAGVF